MTSSSYSASARRFRSCARAAHRGEGDSSLLSVVHIDRTGAAIERTSGVEPVNDDDPRSAGPSSVVVVVVVAA
jgi:hypothetical protein